MINLSESSLLMIEPTGAPSVEPVLDELTCRMAAALNEEPAPDVRYRGVHFCTGWGCTAISDNGLHSIAGLETNSLAVHYLAHHRSDVPASELAKLESVLPQRIAQPTAHQLTGRRS